MQSRLFPDSQPLVERLGRDFFRKLPEIPGVYLMRDGAASVLYVGKAKNLRKRVCSYRVANPERMPRRTLRLLRLVESISWEECEDEQSALRRESELLLALKPRFNRAGIWKGASQFLVWRCIDGHLELALAENPFDGWESFGPCGGKVKLLRVVLVRLIWFAMDPTVGIAGMPVGWADGRMGAVTIIPLRNDQEVLSDALRELLLGRPQMFCNWLMPRITHGLHPFLRSAVEADLKFINEL